MFGVFLELKKAKKYCGTTMLQVKSLMSPKYWELDVCFTNLKNADLPIYIFFIYSAFLYFQSWYFMLEFYLSSPFH